MKLSCNVVGDILPMYYDSVCSDESASLVEAHLKECPRCSRMLADLHSGVDIPENMVDDLTPLRSIQKKWKSSRRAYLIKGICYALAMILLIGAVMSSVWYFQYARYFSQLTKGMERTPEENAFFTSSDYTAEIGGYRFEVWVPIVLSNSGFVRVMDEDGLILFLYPEVGGSYSFWLYIADKNNQSYCVYLKSDMTPDFENHQFPVKTEAQKDQIAQLLIEQQSEVAAMLDAVEALWGIELLEYAD